VPRVGNFDFVTKKDVERLRRSVLNGLKLKFFPRNVFRFPFGGEEIMRFGMKMTLVKSNLHLANANSDKTFQKSPTFRK